MTEIITRQYALDNNLKTYFIGMECPKGHVAPRKVLNSECTECARIYMQQYLKDYYQRNKGKIKTAITKPKVREHVRIRSDRMLKQKYRYKNDGNGYGIKKINEKYYRPYMPSWADKERMKSVYIEAKRLREETGLEYEVDHIIPIKGKNVCGLHVENNLRIVKRLENRKKYNKVLNDLLDE